MNPGQNLDNPRHFFEFLQFKTLTLLTTTLHQYDLNVYNVLNL